MLPYLHIAKKDVPPCYIRHIPCLIQNSLACHIKSSHVPTNNHVTCGTLTREDEIDFFRGWLRYCNVVATKFPNPIVFRLFRFYFSKRVKICGIIFSKRVKICGIMKLVCSG